MIEFFYCLTKGYDRMMKQFDDLPLLRKALEDSGIWHEYYGSRLRYAVSTAKEWWRYCNGKCEGCKYMEGVTGHKH